MYGGAQHVASQAFASKISIVILIAVQKTWFDVTGLFP